MPNIAPLIFVAALMFCVLSGVTLLAHIYNLNNIKAKTVGDGQHGTARRAMTRYTRLSTLQRCMGLVHWPMNGGMAWTITWAQDLGQRGCSRNSPPFMRPSKSLSTP